MFLIVCLFFFPNYQPKTDENMLFIVFFTHNIAGMVGNLLILCENLQVFSAFLFGRVLGMFSNANLIDAFLEACRQVFQPISLGKRRESRSFGGGFTGDLDETVPAHHSWDLYMDVSENSGTPKSSILAEFGVIIPIFGNTHIYLLICRKS